MSVPPEPPDPSSSPDPAEVFPPPDVPGTSPEPLRLRLRTLSDLIAAVPYLIGFHPADSLVVVGFTGPALVFAARLDLPGPGGALSTAARYAVSLIRRQAVQEAVLVGYGEPPDVDPLLARCEDQMAYAGLTLRDALRVTGDRYWSVLCDVPECCPADGVRFDLTSSEVAAAATLAGRVAHPDRAAVERLIAPVGGDERGAIARATARAEADLQVEFETSDLAAARRRLVRRGERLLDSAVRRYRDGSRLDHHEVATLSVLMLLTEFTDAVWRRVLDDPGHRSVPMWTDLTRRVQPDLSAPLATLLGYAAWRNGEAALARVATQRALHVLPGYEPAEVMHDILVTGAGRSTLSALFPNAWTPYGDSDRPDAP